MWRSFEQLSMNEMHLPQVRLCRVRATRERCFTVVPQWASPSTPRPASSLICDVVTLENECIELVLTAMTRGFICKLSNG